MKKYILFSFLLLTAIVTKSQISITEDIALLNNAEKINLGLSCMTTNANNSLAYSSSVNNRWWAIGVSTDAYWLSLHTFSLFTSLGINLGWSKEDNNTMLDLTVAVNCAYHIYYNDFLFMPHTGIGFMDNIIFVNNNDSQYKKTRLFQECGYVPVGIRICWKNLFADITYRIRFLRSALHEYDNYFDDDIYLKNTRGYDNGVKTFPVIFTLGVGF